MVEAEERLASGCSSSFALRSLSVPVAINTPCEYALETEAKLQRLLLAVKNDRTNRTPCPDVVDELV